MLLISGVRHSSKKGAGYTRNQGKNRTGKRLGAKKVEGEYVKPGHVIMRQRGTKYYSGKNASFDVYCIKSIQPNISVICRFT